MKVCLITGEFPPMQGGVGDFTNELGKALAELGCEVSVITSTQGQGARDRGQGVTPIPYPLSIFPIIEKWDWGSWRRIIGLLSEIRPRILHIQYQAAAYGMHPAINLLPLRLRMGR